MTTYSQAQLLQCCRAILFQDAREVALGKGLSPDDITRVSRLDSEVVRDCLSFLTSQKFLRPAHCGAPDEFLVNDSEELSYYVDSLSKEQASPGRSVVHVHVGTQNTQNITGSTIGAVAVGASAQARGGVCHGVDPQAWLASIEGAQHVAVGEQDKLDELADGMYEALTKLFRELHGLQVAQLTASQLQAQIQGCVDDIWADEQLIKLRDADTNSLGTLKALTGPTLFVVKVLLGQV